MATRKPGKAKPRVKPLPKNDDENYIRRPSGIATDTYSNPPARLGAGTPNLLQASQYPLIRLTEDYPLILSLYRGSWIVRRVVDTMVNDMWKSFPVIQGSFTPDEHQALAKAIRTTDTLKKLRSGAKWGRLFGGAACIIVIEGHDDLMQPLRLEDIELAAFKGLIPLDRWSGVIPGPEICSDINQPTAFGLPTYYNCIMDAGNVNVHHSRILRFTGRELPQWEVQVELYWGMSEVELIFDELRKRDYSSWNIVSLLTRAQILAITEPQLATSMSGAGANNKSFNSFVSRMEDMSQLLNNQGLMILGKDSALHQTQYGFGGISNTYYEFMKDLAAACEIPYEIIFGRETGLGSNSEGSLQIYDNLIGEKRISDGDPIMYKLLPVICQSTLGYVPDDLDHTWSPFRALSEEQRNNLARGSTDAIVAGYNSDLLTKKEARQALKISSGVHGLFDISQTAIDSTPDTYASETGMEEGSELLPGAGGGDPSEEDDEESNPSQPSKKTAKPSGKDNPDEISRKRKGDSAMVDSQPKDSSDTILEMIRGKLNTWWAGK